MRYNLFFTAALAGFSTIAYGQVTSADIRKANLPAANPTDAEIFSPVPNVVTPAATFGQAPSDAVILFDGKNLNEWVNAKDKAPAMWKVADGILTVDKTVGDIQTTRKFGSFQLHVEWKIPADITGKGQERGNSGIFLSDRYEIQVLDTYNNDNKTYTNGMAGSVYRESIPLVNPAHKAGEWNVYDIAYQAPEFNEDGSVKTPAHVTILFNGVLVQNNTEIRGGTSMTNVAHAYKAHAEMPLRLQAHGDKSEPISYRNIWIRE